MIWEIETYRTLLTYEPTTGKLYWSKRPRDFFKSDGEMIRWNNRYAGREAFRVNANGYRSGMILRKCHRAHQVAWLLFYGCWPNGDIDHINGRRDDNRIENLRVVSRKENCRNRKRSAKNRTGVNGVSEHLPGRWRAYIGTDTGNIYLGVFHSFEAAVAARKEAEKQHGYHQNHGRAA